MTMMDHAAHERLARIEANTDVLIKRFDKLDDRVHAVEKKQWMHTGVLSVPILGVLLNKFGFTLT